MKNKLDRTEYQKNYHIQHKEMINKRHKKYYQIHRDRMKKWRIEYYYNHREEELERKHIYDEMNQEKIKSYRKSHRKNHNKYISDRCKKDLNFKLRRILCGRIRIALKTQAKHSSTVNLCDCSIEFLKHYLENKFKPGMSWNNWNENGWHIDHIRPCASFDLSKPSEQRKCFHYTNLQPLWAEDNRKKGSKI